MQKVNFDKQEALELAKLLITTNTVNPPGNELALINKLRPLLEKEGLAVEVDEFAPGRANMVITYPGADAAKPCLALTGHLDTVPVGQVPWEHDPFAFEIVDDVVYGRGTADMKGPDAAMLYALILLKRNGVVPKQNVKFIATAGEETLSLGANAFVAKDGMKDVGTLLVGEPSNMELIVAHKGAVWVKVEFFGKTAHGSMPDLGVNAVLQMTKFIEILRRQQFPCAPDAELGMTTFSINTVQGGAATNVVPDHAECTIDFRTIPGQTWEDVEAFLNKALREAAAGDVTFAYKYSCLGPVLNPVACPKGHHLLDDLDKAAGYAIKRTHVNFFTDASVLVKPGLPVVIFGPADSKQAHQPNEHMPLAQFYEAIRVYYNFIKDYEV